MYIYSCLELAAWFGGESRSVFKWMALEKKAKQNIYMVISNSPDVTSQLAPRIHPDCFSVDVQIHFQNDQSPRIRSWFGVLNTQNCMTSMHRSWWYSHYEGGSLTYHKEEGNGWCLTQWARDLYFRDCMPRGKQMQNSNCPMSWNNSKCELKKKVQIYAHT